jgi:cell division protein ZapA
MSADQPRGLDITILGREFRVACSAEEETDLLKAASYLDKKMREIRDGAKVIGIERIAIMAALNIAHELLSNPNKPAFDMSEFKRRMASMQAAIDEAVSDQNKLF